MTEEQRFIDVCKTRNFPATRIGSVDSNTGIENDLNSQTFQVDGVFGGKIVLELDQIKELSEGAFPK